MIQLVSFYLYRTATTTFAKMLSLMLLDPFTNFARISLSHARCSHNGFPGQGLRGAYDTPPTRLFYEINSLPPRVSP